MYKEKSFLTINLRRPDLIVTEHRQTEWICAQEEGFKSFQLNV